VTRDFAIHYTWESALHDAPEVRETSALLTIMLGNTVVTRNVDTWSRTVRDEVRLSAYPLALWCAASWWRLRWEPLPMRPATPHHSWRMAHEMAAAGYGYLWPQMLFVSDGENMHVWARQSAPDSQAAVRYLLDAHHAVPGAAFEQTLDEFMAHVLARLDAVGVRHTTLHDLWHEILEERYDADLAAYRRLEAMLGFDPDECPEELYQRFVDLIPRAGAAAIAELAPVCASADPGATLEQVMAFADAEGLEGHIDFALPPGDATTAIPTPAWERGRALARRARAAAGLHGGVVTDERLCELVNLPTERTLNTEDMRRTRDMRRPHPLLSMAIRHDASQHLKFLLRKRNKPGRRFELARLLGAALMAANDDRWLPATDAKTARQKMQRAFAIEFLCPIQSLTAFLGDDFSSDATEEAAEHFGVSYKAVETHLVNNHLLSVDVLHENDNVFEFPYPIPPNLL
jgi:hypothetical protein